MIVIIGGKTNRQDTTRQEKTKVIRKAERLSSIETSEYIRPRGFRPILSRDYYLYKRILLLPTQRPPL